MSKYVELVEKVLSEKVMNTKLTPSEISLLKKELSKLKVKNVKFNLSSVFGDYDDLEIIIEKKLTRGKLFIELLVLGEEDNETGSTVHNKWHSPNITSTEDSLSEVKEALRLLKQSL